VTVAGPAAARTAVVFDFDGVIANSEPLHLVGFQRVLAERGIVLSEDEYFARYLGYADQEAFEVVGRDAGRPFSGPEVRELMSRKAALMPSLLASPRVLFPDAADCVRRLAAHVPLAIASGALRSEIELVLEANGLSACFHAIVAAGETERSKPAPDPYSRAVRLLVDAGVVAPGVTCVAIEDSHWGITSAQQAGLRCVGVATSYPAAELGVADFVVEHLADLSIEQIWTLIRPAS
jgi:beta-phosphoglucomutase